MLSARLLDCTGFDGTAYSTVTGRNGAVNGLGSPFSRVRSESPETDPEAQEALRGDEPALGDGLFGGLDASLGRALVGRAAALATGRVDTAQLEADRRRLELALRLMQRRTRGYHGIFPSPRLFEHVTTAPCEATAVPRDACSQEAPGPVGSQSWTALQLVQKLLVARRDLCLPRALRALDVFDAVILDDLGYVQQTAEEAEVLFTLMAERYERRSLIITSNLVFSEWDRIFKTPMATAAAIDRLVHHAAIIEIDRESVRAEEAKKRNESRKKKEDSE